MVLFVKSIVAVVLVNWVLTGGWFANASTSQYSESYSGTQEEKTAIEDILKNGNRTIPPEIVEHDSLSDIKSIEVDGTTYTDHDNIYNKANYKEGQTKIVALGDPYLFYAWANPDGQTATEAADPFGYFESNPPKGSSTKGSSSSACCDKTEGGVTTAEIDGHKYAFPLAGATKANYLNASTFGSDQSVLSPIPCTDLTAGVCHHDYNAVDMGLMRSMVDGKQQKASDYPSLGYSDMYYNSTGVSVVAVVSGTVNYARHTYSLAADGWNDKCGSIVIDGEDGHSYLFVHLAEESITLKAGDKVTVGDKIAEIGAPSCAEGTQSHLHFDNGSVESGDPTWSVQLINKLWESLPDSDNGTTASTCSDTGLKTGGLTYDEAAEMMEEYRQLAIQTDGKSSIEVNNRTFTGYTGCTGGLLSNCVAFSRYFIYKYVNAPEGAYSASSGNGEDIVGFLKDNGFKTGKEPRPYAIFSWSNSGAGHTGVVLGVIDSNTFITGEASCSHDNSKVEDKHGYGIGAFERSLDDGNDWTFAYTDGMISGI